ncbi:MAG TPA: translocation/assembly module TamB domain-containing protein [Terracidiphilus sp.]|nr:translocation/assembly module TamB domain-containing protein [Terracidiphilus sp.]
MSQDDTPPNANQPRGRLPLKLSRERLRVIAWLVGGIDVFILTSVLVLIVLLNSDRVHTYLINWAQTKASESLGVEVQLQNFELHMDTLSLDLYGLRAMGADPYPNPPLLSIDHVAVGVRIVSLFSRKWYLDNLRIDHPVGWVIVDKNGMTNLPMLKRNNTSHTDIFQLGIRHAVVEHGEIYYNDKPSALAADLHDLNFRSSFDGLRTMYAGSLTYSNGQLEYGGLRPFRHDFDADFTATPSTFQLTHAKLTSGPSQAIVSATLNNFSSPIIQCHYDLTADGDQVAQLLVDPSIPSGVIRTVGSIQFQQIPNSSMLQRLNVDGELTSNRLALKSGSIHGEVANIAAHYLLANGNGTLEYLRAQLLGGSLTAQGTIRNLGGDSRSIFRADLHHLSLAAARTLFGQRTSVKNVALAGEANATVTTTWGRTISDLVAHADANMNGQITRSNGGGVRTTVEGNPSNATGSNTTIPIDGVFHATYTNSNRGVKLVNSYLRSSQTNLDLNGDLSNRSSLSVRLQANDLRELASVANLFSAQNAGQSLLDLAGEASFQGTVTGSTVAPHLTGKLTAENLHLNGSEWKALNAGVDLSSTHVGLQNLIAESTTKGRITGTASAGLHNWSLTKQSPIQAELNVSQMNAATLARIGGQQIPVTGILSARIHLRGDAFNPAGNGDVTLRNALVYEQPVSSAKVDFTGSGSHAEANLSVQMPAGAIRGQVTVEPEHRTFTAQLNSTGIDLSKLQALKSRNIDATGVAAIQAHSRGSFDNPEINASLHIPSLAIANQKIAELKLDASLANRIANAELTSSLINTDLHAKAQIKLTGDYPIEASLDTQSMPLQPLLATYAPEQAENIRGQTEIHAKLSGPLKNKTQLEAQVTIPILNVAYGNTVQLAAASPIRASYKNGVIDLQPATIRGTDTDLQFQGSLPIVGNTPASLRVHGTVNLNLAQLFNPDLRSSGELKLNIDATGAGANLGGEIDVVDANLSSITQPVGLQHGNAVLKVLNDRLQIEKFEGAVGGGAVTAQGAVLYRPRIQFDLGIAAKGVRLLYPQGVRETLNGNLRFTGTGSNATIGGSVNIADLSFTPAFDLTTLVDQLSGGVAAPVGPGFEQNLALNIAVNSTSNVNLVSRTLSVGGSANLQVRGTAANPVILGRVNMTGGDIILHGDRFVLNGGTVQFVNPSMTQPVVNVSLTTTIQEYKIDLRFNGPADQLRTQYTSDPALPPADIINLLAFGKTNEASAAQPNQSSASTQAESLVASQVSSQVTSRISKAAGISQLSISPVLAGSTAAGPPGANITIQQRVTGNLFVTFSTNVASTQGQTIQGQYQVTPRVAVSATRDPNGGFAFDTLIKKSW